MKKQLIGFLIILFCIELNAQTGIAVPEMVHCDNLVTDFISTHNIPAASFAMTKNGKLIYHRAFGYADVAATESTQPHHLFRIASISKPITSMAIMNMVENNEVALSDKVFGVNGILENHSILSNATITDSRIYDITVQNLLEHSAGWNRDLNCFPDPVSPYPWYFYGCDPIIVPLYITQTNGTTNPSTEEDMIVFLLEKGLDFTPNTAYAYSNIGYLVLGEIIEEVSGQTYEDYVKVSLLSQLGNCDMHIGGNLLADKKEREVEYVGEGYTTLSCYGDGTFVPWEYGGFNVEAMDAHGGWIATTRDLLNLLLAVDGFSSKPDILAPSTITTMTTPSANNTYYAKGWSVNPSNNWWHSGALDGSATFFARTSGEYTWAVFLNKRITGAGGNQFWADFDALPWACLNGTTTFPTHDLLDIPTTSSSSLAFSSITTNSMTLNWTNGNGDKRIVVAKANGTISDFPLDGSSYTANASFSSGDDLGNSTYVVYDGTGSTVNISNLQPNTSYSFRIFDYNESTNTGNNKLYKLCGGASDQESSGGTLPVELLEFRAFEKQKNVVLTWQTASEENNAGFQIERSSNTRDWQALDFVEGKGTTEELQKYNYTDQRPIPGYNYYRLKQIDYDGQFEYSEVRTVLVNNDENKLVEVYPNPSQGQFTLSLYNPDQKNARIKLFDSTGNTIWQQDFRKQEAVAYWERQFDLPQREVYFVMTQVGEVIETMKVSVVNNK